MKNWAVGLLLGIILLIGLSFRLYQLTDIPHGFFADEAAIGYNAYTILYQGRDEYGKVFPLFFQSFGDYKDPVEIYFTVPFIILFGLSEFATRLPSVVWGIITIVGVYFLTKEIKNSKLAGLFAALTAATMPWLVHYNRVGFELNAYAALWVCAIYFLIKASKKPVYFYPGAILTGLTLYSYQPAKLLVPLLLIGFVLTYHYSIWKHKKIVLQSSMLFLLFAIPMVVSFFDVAGTARFAMVSVFSKHLSFQETIFRVFSNYFYQFYPTFFITGEPTFITRHFTKGLLPLLPITIPFVVLGILVCMGMLKKASSQFLLWALLLYPVAGAVVAEAPFTSRSVIGAPIFAVLIGLGIDWVLRVGRYRMGKIILGTIIGALFLLNTILFARFYFTEYPMYSSDFWGWQYGAAPIMQYFLVHKNEYDDLALTGSFNAAEIFLKFYDPEHTCKGCKIAQPKDIFDPHKKQLFSLTPDDIAKDTSFDYHTVGQIFYPTGVEAFRLVTVTKK